MYSGESSPSSKQSNAKICIQALLKNREQNSYAQVPSTKDFLRSRICSSIQDSTSNYFEPDISLPSFESSANLRASEDWKNEINHTDHPDNQKDFNYSQKLFHISDGNLYSVFSPIQGRSYGNGMKPSFLRKQKYTVQECHNRGRKNLRKGLKFHNFLPSESVTSEKDSGLLKTKWKVHSECRLREEHGTKQITISNWSQSVQGSSKDVQNFDKKVKSSTKTSATSRQTESSSPQNDLNDSELNSTDDPYDFNLSYQNINAAEDTNYKYLPTQSSTVPKTFCKASNSTRSVPSKRGALSSVLNSLLDKSVTTATQNTTCDINRNFSNSSYQSQKHRRKPTQTRRIVPYCKYLSIMEENDDIPLDLSSKYADDCTESHHSTEESQSMKESNIEHCPSSLLKSAITNTHLNFQSASTSNSNYFMPSTSSSNVITSPIPIGNILQNQLSAPLMFISPTIKNSLSARPAFLESSLSHEVGSENSKLNAALTSNQFCLQIPTTANFGLISPSSENAHFGVHKPFVNESHSRTRRRNQRSVVKQKLEDTFKQNGFLVKTKQVSDGEATFCKFRQLRKYTRYYLKNWQQHLPDEVNKMWKGFLPPKTVLPTISNVEPPNNMP